MTTHQVKLQLCRVKMMVIFEKVSSNILRQRILSRRKGKIGVNYLKHLKSKYN